MEKFALSYAPSRSVFRYCLSLNRGTAASREHTILLLDGTDGLRYHASVPIYFGGRGDGEGRRIGVMNVAMPEWRSLSAEELQFLQSFLHDFGIGAEENA